MSLVEVEVWPKEWYKMSFWAIFLKEIESYVTHGFDTEFEKQ